MLHTRDCGYASLVIVPKEAELLREVLIRVVVVPAMPRGRKFDGEERLRLEWRV